MAHFELFIDKLLGEGSYGKVYKCNWYNSLAAAKLFNVDTDEPVDVTREIEMIKELQNDYIIQFFGTIYYNDKLYLITSYAEKGSLYQALTRHTLSGEQKPNIITGLIKGMLYLKTKNVVHRDLKSPNVLLDKNFVPKICDFGLARLKVNSATHIKTSKGIVGTTRWMAPELFQINPRYSFASDVYALGTVVWEILSEKLPYANIMDTPTVVVLIRNGEHEEIPNNAPEHYKTIIKKCWHVDPKDRISVEEINQMNDDVRQHEDNMAEDVFDKEISPSLQQIDSDSGLASAQMPPTMLSRYSVKNISRKPRTKPVDYAEALDHHLQVTTGISDSRGNLASVLQIYGDRFVQWLNEASILGDDTATTVLGEVFYHGLGASQDYQTATVQFFRAAVETVHDQTKSRIKKLFKKSSTQGNVRAQNNLGWMYASGEGVPQNDIKAVEWFKKAAKQGNASAQSNLGWMYEYGRGIRQNTDKAVKWYTKAAVQGYVTSQFNMGRMYEAGKGVSQSDSKAMEWYTKAANQGNADAQFNLGLMYENGKGVDQNGEKAAEWYMKAANQGNVSAQLSLGHMYENGLDIQQNDEKAVEWYTKAAETGNASGQNSLGRIYETGRGVPQSYHKAVELYMKSADQGYSAAESNLGRMYALGWGVPQSNYRAIELFEKAADQGNANAQSNLGWMYANGRGVPQSDKKAVEWYTKAAELGDATGQNSLGWMYENGRGVPQSNHKAVELYKKAADQGNASAQHNLAWMYESGRGDPQGEYKTGNWYSRSASIS